MHTPKKKNKLILEVPDTKELSKEYMCIDMHTHSRYSDGSATIKKIIEKAKRDSFGVAITDHNTIKGSLMAKKLANGKIPVIPGIEVNCSNGRDILLYFYNIKELEKFFKDHIKEKLGPDPSGRTKVDMYELLDLAHKHDCVVIAPHPFGIAYKNLNRIIKKDQSYKYLEKLDALEILNGEMPRKINLKAVTWNFNLNIGFTGGSDGHTLKEIGGVVTCSKAKSIKEFLDNIKKQNNFVMGKEINLRKKAVSYPHIMRKHAMYIHPKLLEKISRYKLVRKLWSLDDDE